MERGGAIVLFAGGGTGGHIYPNIAILERHRERAGVDAASHFLLSDRPGDAQTAGKLGLAFTASPVRPVPGRPWPHLVISFLLAWRRGVAQARAVIERERVRAVVATGGFVSGPAIVAARELGIPRALVNLDAVPGKANRRLHRSASKVFSTYATPMLPGAEHVGLPLRRASLCDLDSTAARAELGFDRDRPLVFVTGATHGAESVIRAMMALVADREHARRFAGWQVLHQCGTFDPVALQRAYDDAGIDARAVAYLDRMGLAWRAADVAIGRAGAGSVAEAWANATPTIFLPNPYHRDAHQRKNADPLVAAGGALVVDDLVEPAANVAALAPVLARLMDDAAERVRMSDALRRSCPPDGAVRIAEWIAEVAG
jgi:UDP-N-acetylglucosamine--N-acetylmuramyl-(pentapeptide) pyrophosphoryl-undecaprenol N-acetylglucosamine transferase